MKEIVINGMAIAPSVVETVVSKAVTNVSGVSKLVAAGPTGGLAGIFGSKQNNQAVAAAVDENEKLRVAVRIEAVYGTPLPELAAKVRSSVADAVESQIGLPVGSVDVYVDSMQFNK